MTKWSWPNVKIIITAGVYLTCGLSGPNPKPNEPRGRPAGPTPWPTDQVLSRFSPRLHRHVSTWEEDGQGGRSHSTRPANNVVRPTDRRLKSYHLGQVGGAPPGSYKYPPLVEIRTHTPLHGNSTYKALILSVVARHSLIGSVARLWGLEGLPAYREPSL
jgi:hypothetical protein